MNKNKIITAAAIVFFLAGISHLIRIFYGWEITISEWEMPIWVSFTAGTITIFLSYKLLTLKK
tara:strand:+ start:823 stop:1011 length:189 start_codon:yes stop_codon:yes gene_type:complete